MNNLNKEIRIYDHLQVSVEKAMTTSFKLILGNEINKVTSMAQCVTVKAIARELLKWKINDSTIEIEDESFVSEILANLLTEPKKIYAVLVSCQAPDEKPFGDDDLLNYFWDQILEQLLQQGLERLRYELDPSSQFPFLNLLSPGTGEAWLWPIEQQKQLFRILEIPDRIGVKLNEYGLMIPRKTISGLLIPGEHPFNACDYCHREQCPSRRKGDHCVITHF